MTKLKIAWKENHIFPVLWILNQLLSLVLHKANAICKYAVTKKYLKKNILKIELFF